MPIRGAKSPVPKKIPAQNSGILSDSGKGQKMDPVKRDPKVQAAFTEAHANHTRKFSKY